MALALESSASSVVDNKLASNKTVMLRILSTLKWFAVKVFSL
jgi:hypothetical protein